MIKILLVDNQPLTRFGTVAVLTGHADVKVVGTAADTDQLVKLIDQLKPDVAIIDHHSNDFFDAAFLKNIRLQFDFIRILILSNRQLKQEIADFTDNGLCNYLSKQCSSEELIKAISATAKGEPFFCEQTLKTLSPNDETAPAPAQVPGLTARESEIIQLISEGLTNKEIAEKLFLSFHTVKTHRKNIIKKLGFTFKNAGEVASLTRLVNVI